MTAKELMDAMKVNQVEMPEVKQVAPIGVYTVKCVSNTMSVTDDGELVFKFFYAIQGKPGYKNIPHRVGNKLYGTEDNKSSFFSQFMEQLAGQWGMVNPDPDNNEEFLQEILSALIDEKREFKIAWIPSTSEKFDGCNASAKPADIRAAELLVAMEA